MDQSIELLSKQIDNYAQQSRQQFSEYQKQNESDHEKLEQKIDEALSMMQTLFIETSSHKKQLSDLEIGQKEIKGTLESIDKRVESLEEKQSKSDHVRGLVIKGLGVLSVSIGIFATLWKLGVLKSLF